MSSYNDIFSELNKPSVLFTWNRAATGRETRVFASGTVPPLGAKVDVNGVPVVVEDIQWSVRGGKISVVVHCLEEA